MPITLACMYSQQCHNKHYTCCDSKCSSHLLKLEHVDLPVYLNVDAKQMSQKIHQQSSKI